MKSSLSHFRNCVAPATLAMLFSLPASARFQPILPEGGGFVFQYRAPAMAKAAPFVSRTEGPVEQGSGSYGSEEISPATRKMIEKLQRAVPRQIGKLIWPSRRDVAGQQAELRLDHARELLGSRYDTSVVRSGESVAKVNEMVYQWTHDSLPQPYRRSYQKVAQTLIDEAFKYEFDPIFLMSVIRAESSWNPKAHGPVGEIGLMQLRPRTGKWIASRTSQKWKGARSLQDPVTNIKLGAAYLAYLREYFDSHARLYLAAYNMGQTNVKDAVERHVWPKTYPSRVMGKYVEYYSELKQKMRERERMAHRPLPMDQDDRELFEADGTRAE
jgi:soluble lytic murein transglycosylase